jgi:hypothetical protein
VLFVVLSTIVLFFVVLFFFVVQKRVNVRDFNNGKHQLLSFKILKLLYVISLKLYRPPGELSYFLLTPIGTKARDFSDG